MVYKCINNLALKYLYNMFSTRSQLHDHPMRYQDLLNIPFYWTAAGQKTFQYRGSELWNNLEYEL